jgi:hypothetical protein
LVDSKVATLATQTVAKKVVRLVRWKVESMAVPLVGGMVAVTVDLSESPRVALTVGLKAHRWDENLAEMSEKSLVGQSVVM